MPPCAAPLHGLRVQQSTASVAQDQMPSMAIAPLPASQIENYLFLDHTESSTLKNFKKHPSLACSIQASSSICSGCTSKRETLHAQNLVFCSSALYPYLGSHNDWIMLCLRSMGDYDGHNSQCSAISSLGLSIGSCSFTHLLKAT